MPRAAPNSRSPAKGRPLLRLLPLVNEHWLPFWGGMGLTCFARVFEAGVPLMVRLAINRLSVAANPLVWPAILVWPTLAILCLAVCRYLSVSVGRKYVRQVGVTVTYDMRERLYWHFQLQGPRFFARFPTGDLMARAINDLNLVRQMISVASRTVFVLVFSGLIAFSFMLALSPQLTLWLLPVMPFIAGAGYMISRRIYLQSLKVQEGFSSLSEFVQENLNGIRTIQTHAQEGREVSRFRSISGGYAEHYFKLMWLNASLGAWMTALTGISTLIIVGYGGYLVLNHALSIGTFTAFVLYLGMVVTPIQQAGQMVTMVQRGSSAAARLFEVLDWQPEIRDAPEATPLASVGGAISIRHLTFVYPPRQGTKQRADRHQEGWRALNDVSLEIAAGEMLAILGRIGSGKTTLLKLIVRLLDPPAGTVFLDSRDVRLLPLAQVRGQIAMVPQEPFLFADELGRNITYDNPRRELDRVWSAAEAADLEDTIASFPEQLATLVGERGVTLSGGQKQRASLARGLIRDTPVLLLDDCFSSVDTETEEHILSRLKKLRAGRTTLLVSHRVSTARHADRILVLDEGRIAELGTHTELMTKGGIYAHFALVQGRKEALELDLDHAAETVK